MLSRRAAAAALVAGVAAVHLWLAGDVLDAQLGEGSANRRDAAPKRIDVAFVRQLAQSTPAAAPALSRPRPPPRPRGSPPAVAQAAPAASAAQPGPAPAAAPQPPPLEPDAATALAPAAEPAASATATATATAPSHSDAPAALVLGGLAQPGLPSASAAAAAPPAFDWPPSTRLTYTLSGNYRGAVDGQAQVEWLRSGARYQVRLDLSVGPSFAPVGSRHLVSDGELTAAGLQPRRYDEETRVAFRDTRRIAIHFDGARIRLANGNEVAQPPGAQDTASQFVQLTWLFTTRPELLQVGQQISIPLALPRYLDNWVYEVIARDPLTTPVGLVDTWHVKPRRAPRGGAELTAEMWIAPSLQYLPVRIVIRQDADTYLDMLIDKLPLQQAAPAPPSATAQPPPAGR